MLKVQVSYHGDDLRAIFVTVYNWLVKGLHSPRLEIFFYEAVISKVFRSILLDS